MPFIRRVVLPGKNADDPHWNPVTQGGPGAIVEKWVRSKAVKPTDVVLDPSISEPRDVLYIRPEVLQALACDPNVKKNAPKELKEFEAARVARGIAALVIARPADDEEGPEEEDE